MSISVKIGGVLVPITEVITRMGGVLISKTPLQAKIGGILVDFISYGYSTTAMLNLSPIGFDSSMLQSTINAIPSNIDVIVRFGSGTFLFNTSCNITRSNVSLIGSVHSVLKCNGNMGVYGLLYFSGTSDSPIENITVEGLTIDGDYITSGHTCYVIQCTYVGKSFVNIGSSYDATKCGNTYTNKKGVTIKGCILKNSSYTCVEILYCNNSLIVGNTIQNNGSNGIYLYTSNSISVINNIIQNNTTSGCSLSSTSITNLISGNKISNNHSEGISLSGCNFNVINENNIQNNYSDGITLSNTSSNNSITGNTIQNNNSNGINIVTANNNSINGNAIIYNAINGIYLNSGNTNSIIGNVIQANANYGIRIDNGCTNSIVQSDSMPNNGTSIVNNGITTKLNFII